MGTQSKLDWEVHRIKTSRKILWGVGVESLIESYVSLEENQRFTGISHLVSYRHHTHPTGNKRFPVVWDGETLKAKTTSLIRLTDGDETRRKKESKSGELDRSDPPTILQFTGLSLTKRNIYQFYDTNRKILNTWCKWNSMKNFKCLYLPTNLN